MIRNWFHGTIACHKFLSLHKATMGRQANIRRKCYLALLSDEEEDRLLSILEEFVRYTKHRLQETEDALFEASRRLRF